MRHSRETDAAQTVRQTETAKSTQRSFNLPVSLVPCSLAQRAWCGCRCRSILSMWPQSRVVVCAGSCRQCPIRCVLSVQVSDMISSRDCRRRRQPSRALAAASLASHQLISAVRCAAPRCTALRCAARRGMHDRRVACVVGPLCCRRCRRRISRRHSDTQHHS